MKKVAWLSRRKAVVSGIIIIFIVMITPLSLFSVFSTNYESETHYIYIDANESEGTIVFEPIKLDDKIFVSLRTYNRSDSVNINLNSQAFEIISQKTLNLPDTEAADYKPLDFGRVYKYELLSLKSGQNEISFSLSEEDAAAYDNSEIKVIIPVENRKSVVQSVSAKELVKMPPRVSVLKPIVILVDFSDTTASYSVSTPTFYQNLLFGERTKSLYDYYLENSLGKLEVRGTAYANSSSDTQWFTAPEPYSYYVGSSNGMGTYPHNTQKLVEDIIDIIDPVVDFSEHDGDGDGVVDGIFIIYAGRQASSQYPDKIYPHMWSIAAEKRDGKIICDYDILPEYRYEPGDATIGPFCHEFGHILGAIDLYDLDGLSYFKYDGEKSNGLGKWSIMANGVWGATKRSGDTPSHFDAWHKIKFGWIEPTIITGDLKSVSIPAVELEEGKIYKYVLESNPDEYFLIENRQQIGFDSKLPGAGILIYHIDESATSNSYAWSPFDETPNEGHYKVSLVQADGLWDLERKKDYGDDGDPFPGSTDNRVFSMDTLPNSNLYDGTPTYLKISNISDCDSYLTITVDFSILGD